MRRVILAAAAVAAVAAVTGGGFAAAAGGMADVTFAGCLSGGTLRNVQVTRTPGCASYATPVQWAGQAAVTTSPSPSPSPDPSPTSPGTGTACVTSAYQGSCGPYTGPEVTGIGGIVTVGNDVWTNSGTQTLTANGPADWSVTANQPAGNTSVRAYPNTGTTVPWIAGTSANPALSTWSSMTSTFAEDFQAHTNGGTIGEAAYDIWLNNWANEVMIQTDFAGDTARPRCDGIGAVITTQTFGGTGGVPAQTWDLCQFGSELIWQLPTGTNLAAGSVDILGMLTWLETHGSGSYLPAGSTLTAVGFGFEICSTGGQDETFPLTGFTLTAVAAG
jgi:hypothetical protein